MSIKSHHTVTVITLVLLVSNYCLTTTSSETVITDSIPITVKTTVELL